MTTPATPPAPKSTGNDRNFVAVDETSTVLTFEDRLRIFWQKNGKSVITLLIVLLVAIVAKGGWEYLQAQKEQDTEREYAAAGTPEKLKAFAAAHAGHSLAGIARLRLADDAYAAGKPADAISGYEEAMADLKTGLLASRAKLGLAMAKLQAGRTADGEAALKQLAADTTEAKGVRVEASYHLASLASTAGKADEVKKYSEQILQLAPNSPWTQRVFMLRASLPAAESASPGTTPAVTLPGVGK